MAIHYLIYGLTGLIMEVFWTGLGSLLQSNYALTGHTYLWMFFIYGLGVFFEPIHDKIRTYHLVLRGLLWTVLIFLIEFLSGLLLQWIIGYCPWDYRKATKLTLYGYIRLDYFPVWFIVGLLFEKYHDFLDKITLKAE